MAPEQKPRRTYGRVVTALTVVQNSMRDPFIMNVAPLYTELARQERTLIAELREMSTTNRVTA
jgi:hypothetical protein